MISGSEYMFGGNWSRKEETLLTGDYLPLLPAFTKMNVDQFVLEFATPRAGEIEIVGKALNHKELGLGVINPRTDEIESVEFIVGKVEKALEFYSPKRFFSIPIAVSAALPKGA